MLTSLCSKAKDGKVIDNEPEASNDKPRARFHLHLRDRRGEFAASSTLVKATPYDLGAIAQSIQNLARSTAPIGKVMDFLPKELNRMNLERDHWLEEYARHGQECVHVKQKNQEVLEPLQIELRGIEDEIERVKQLMQSTNIQIHQNNEWIRARLRRFSEHQV